MDGSLSDAMLLAAVGEGDGDHAVGQGQRAVRNTGGSCSGPGSEDVTTRAFQIGAENLAAR